MLQSDNSIIPTLSMSDYEPEGLEEYQKAVQKAQQADNSGAVQKENDQDG